MTKNLLKIFPLILSILFSSLLYGDSTATLNLLKSLCPPGAAYEEALSEASMGGPEATNKAGQKARINSERYLFTTNLSFSETKSFLEEKGIHLSLSKKEDLISQMQKKGIRSGGEMEKLLKDPTYASAHGSFDSWLVILSSHFSNPQTHEIVGKTAITFMRLFASPVQPGTGLSK